MSKFHFYILLHQNGDEMKRICLLSTLLLAVAASAQNRIVLVEEFTNTGCGPCASWSPELDAVIEKAETPRFL